MKGSFSLEHKKKINNAVLLFHGLTGAPGELFYLGKSLYKAGYNVFCPVLPGHCRGTEALKKTKWTDWCDFAVSEYDKLKETYKNVYVSGICLGAVLALVAAAERKSVKGISCLSTTLFLDGWSIPWFAFLLPFVLYTPMKFYYSFPEGGALGVKNKDVRKKIEASFSDDSYLDCYPIICVLELLRLSRFIRSRLHKIKSPALIFHSERDDLTSVKSAKTVMNNLRSKNKECVYLEDSYHLISLDNDKDLVFDRTIDFFNGLANAGTQ